MIEHIQNDSFSSNQFYDFGETVNEATGIKEKKSTKIF
jgi:hypothetical protein